VKRKEDGKKIPVSVVHKKKEGKTVKKWRAMNRRDQHRRQRCLPSLFGIIKRDEEKASFGGHLKKKEGDVKKWRAMNNDVINTGRRTKLMISRRHSRFCKVRSQCCSLVYIRTNSPPKFEPSSTATHRQRKINKTLSRQSQH
jgi:hypothetical protein